MRDIISICTSEGDRILDFFMGSGTTHATAHKMKRKYIGIEQMSYLNSVSVPRLQKVIEGEQTGISTDVNWQGGNTFVYAELKSLNDEYIHQIQCSHDEVSLQVVLSKMKQSAYLNFKIELEKISFNNEEYSLLSLDEKKRILFEILDLNQLYLSYSEIDDLQYDISNSTKQFNRSFYDRLGGE
ncbi:hypothetical protein SDC9_58930 [bioreactor metagenome]|uniref:DNA methylase N-4/N-6 domain-containing protein n=1 Tax=bioreactor metagenome TaxID=1076179 RepID=A0A644X9I9_9ZZZZ